MSIVEGFSVSEGDAGHYTYDAAISFAGANRSMARDVYDALVGRGMRIFFDEESKVELWGKDVTIELERVYS